MPIKAAQDSDRNNRERDDSKSPTTVTCIFQKSESNPKDADPLVNNINPNPKQKNILLPKGLANCSTDTKHPSLRAIVKQVVSKIYQTHDSAKMLPAQQSNVEAIDDVHETHDEASKSPTNVDRTHLTTVAILETIDDVHEPEGGPRFNRFMRNLDSRRPRSGLSRPRSGLSQNQIGLDRSQRMKQSKRKESVTKKRQLVKSRRTQKLRIKIQIKVVKEKKAASIIVQWYLTISTRYLENHHQYQWKCRVVEMFDSFRLDIVQWLNAKDISALINTQTFITAQLGNASEEI